MDCLLERGLSGARMLSLLDGERAKVVDDLLLVRGILTPVNKIHVGCQVSDTQRYTGI